MFATGREPLYWDVSPSGNGTSNGNSTGIDSDSSSDNGSDSNSREHDGSNNNKHDNSRNKTKNSSDSSNKWTVVNEIGHGGCLVRCIARKVHGDPDQHFITRQQILQHIRDHLYGPRPLFDMPFNDINSGGIQSESVATLGQPDTLRLSRSLPQPHVQPICLRHIY